MLGIRYLTKATTAGRAAGNEVYPNSSLHGVMEVTKVTEATSSSRVAEEVAANEEAAALDASQLGARG